MFEVFSANKCKDMDNATIRDVGIPGIVLMENAAISVCSEIIDKGDSFLILCGKGDNGGDALAICRHLLLAGKNVRVYIISKDENYSSSFQLNLNIIKNIMDENDVIFIKSEDDIDKNIINDLQRYDVVVDGILGIGLNKELRDMLKKIIEFINKYSKFVVSIDIPSGLDCDFGIERGIAVKANLTLTFEVFKKGFFNYKALEYVGDVKVLKIGVPTHIKKEKSDNLYVLEKDEYKRLIPERKIYGHKGNYGRAIIVAGQSGFTGAAFITTECTVRSGAGLTTLICNKDIQPVLESKLVEAMTISTDNLEVIKTINEADSIAFGPGIGVGKEEEKLLEKIISNSTCPIIIDADGITLLGKNKIWLNNLRGRAIITPHPGEMARFLGITVDEIESDRVNIAKEVASKYGIVVLLKGYNTVISDGKNTYINRTGNSKMASGGMGDALTGIINAFLSQGIKCSEAAVLGAYIHGKIADRLANEFYIVNARDIIRELPKQINDIIGE